MSQSWELQATGLVEALKEHEKSISIDVDHFKNILLPYTLTWDNNSTYHPICTEKNKPQEYNHNSLSIDGVIYNMRARQAFQELVSFQIQECKPLPEKNALQKFWQGLFPEGASSYSVEETLGNLKNNEDLIRIMMSEPATPYTLLGRVKSIVSDVEGVSISTRPILVKPGISLVDEQTVYQWEADHTKWDRKKR